MTGRSLFDCLPTTINFAGEESQRRLLQQAIATTSSSNVAIAFEVALVLCEEDNSESLFQSVDVEKDISKGPSYYRFRLGLRLAHLYPSHGLALATIAFLSQSRSGFIPFSKSTKWKPKPSVVCI